MDGERERFEKWPAIRWHPKASLERYVKCAVGLCGNCVIGPYRVCKDGPVFNTEMLVEVREEFGISRMDASGKLIRVNH